MTNKLKVFIYILLGFCFANLAQTATAANTKTKDIRVYALDCGLIRIHDGANFSDTEFYPHKPIVLADPCFLIKHDNHWLLWDLGLGDEYLGRSVENTVYGVILSLPVSLTTQLEQLHLTPSDIKYVGISHMHFDHMGNANLFLHATWLLQRVEYKSLKQDPLPPAVNDNLLKLLLPVPKILITGDHDVFGDGSVTILSTPGHTIGHQSLQLKLPHAGTIILSGDLYHTREAYRFKQNPTFNANRADTLASMARVDDLLKNTHGRLVIQHDPGDFAAFPKFPQFLN
jgi:N-acyl homoserine lactone hydrolase